MTSELTTNVSKDLAAAGDTAANNAEAMRAIERSSVSDHAAHTESSAYPILTQAGQPIRRLVTDFDGTLLNSDEDIAAGNIEAIHATEARYPGFRAIGATGRPWPQLEPYLPQLKNENISDPRYFIVGNGSQIRTETGEILHKVDIPPAALAGAYGVLKQEFGDAAQVGVNRSFSPEELVNGEQRHWFPSEEGYLHEWEGAPNQPAPVEDLLGYPADKMMVRITRPEGWGRDPDGRSYLEVRAAQTQELLGPDFVVTISNAEETLEVGPAGATKGEALRILAGIIKVPLSEMLTIGDNENDRPMLALTREEGGQAVAMRNGRDSLRNPVQRDANGEPVLDDNREQILIEDQLATTMTTMHSNNESGVRDITHGIAAGWQWNESALHHTARAEHALSVN